MGTHQYPRGLLTLELLFAAAIFTLFMSGIVAVASSGQTMQVDVGLSGGGIGYAMSAIQEESQQASTLTGFNALVSDIAPHPYASNTFYNEFQEVMNTAPCMKLVEKTLDWDSEHSRTLSATLETLVPSIEIAQAHSGGCDPGLPPLIDTPEAYDGLTSSDLHGNGTGVAVASIGGVRYAFVTTDSTSQDNFYVIDTSDPENLSPSHIIYSAEIGTVLNGITVARIDGNTYAFVLNDDELMVVDVSIPSTPNELTSAARIFPDVPSGVGRSIAFYDDHLYIGTQFVGCPPPCAPNLNNELHIFNVSTPSDPAWPIWESSINVERNVNAISVDEGYIYLATGPGSTAPYTPLKIYDKSTATLVDSFEMTSSREGTAAFVSGNRLYLGTVGSGAVNDFYIIDNTNPASISNTPLASKNLDGTTSEVGDIAVQGDYVFVGMVSVSSQDTFQVLNISNLPALPRVNHCTAGSPFPQDMNGVVFKDNLIFSSFRSNGVFRIIYDTPNICT